MRGRFAPAVLSNDPDRRRVLVDVLDAALDAVDPAASTVAALVRSGSGITVHGKDVAAPGGVTILALGKAAPAMASAAVEVLGDLVVDGVVASATGDGPPGLACHRGGHPTPDEGSILAGEAVLEAARRAGDAGPGRVVLALISGGGSAIAEVPRPGITLDDLVVTTDALLRSGADVAAVNAVRKHCSALKGGRLAEAAAPARVVTLVISDVVGNPLDAVASGPTVPDPTTFADALAVARSAPVAPAVLAHLQAGAEGRVLEMPAAGGGFGDTVTAVIADGAVAARAAVGAARDLGI
jgi:hydroxypyruvate reductase